MRITSAAPIKSPVFWAARRWPAGAVHAGGRVFSAAADSAGCGDRQTAPRPAAGNPYAPVAARRREDRARLSRCAQTRPAFSGSKGRLRAPAPGCGPKTKTAHPDWRGACPETRLSRSAPGSGPGCGASANLDRAATAGKRRPRTANGTTRNRAEWFSRHGQSGHVAIIADRHIVLTAETLRRRVTPRQSIKNEGRVLWSISFNISA